MKDSTDIHTPATIALIELEASRIYGIRLKHVPLEDEPAKPSNSTARAPSPKPTKANAKAQSKAKPSKPPLSSDQIRKEVLRRVKKAGNAGIRSKDIADLVPGKTERQTAFLNRMIKAGELRKEGTSKDTRYFLAEQERDAG